MTFPKIIYLFDLVGTAAFAASGAIAGVRKKMDIYGIIFLGVVTAVGGGTLRDIIVGRIPPFIFKDYNYLIISIAVSVLTFYFHHIIERRFKFLLIMDALGLGIFTVIGTSIGLEYNIGIVGSVFLGVMTGTFGGMIRDVLQHEIPLVLQKEIYASACLVGGFFFVIAMRMGVSEGISVFVSVMIVFSIRLLAILKNWNLPRPK
ncbi:trimeric intracellular cation channel family protein [Deferribacter autotrophicus]|uniref:Trimeric intracellular cation channel family protein n=1 Tax=Deferribacter autotrophicus TaxID=500465 RepID=A0A5A8F4S9_9BACT|nr:trimeric intracellular cation channel family protein [Deferribacter autotrophicus]KAA0258374.1 trimeric intracellular cation channel family protein [Deferribacter autotrophicus]